MVVRWCVWDKVVMWGWYAGLLVSESGKLVYGKGVRWHGGLW